MRKTCGGEKWGRFSRACLECERRGGYRTPESVFCLLWGSSRRNVERPGVQSGDEQGAGPGWKVGRRQLRTHRHPDLDHQGAGPGWKVGTNRERPGVGSGGAQRLSAHARAQRLRARAQCLRARAQHSPTRRTHPHNNAHRRARPWLQVGHNPCTTRKDQTSTWGYFNDPRHSVRLVDHTSTRAHAIITGAHIQRALSESRIPDPSKTQ